MTRKFSSHGNSIYNIIPLFRKKDLTRKLSILREMKVTVIPILVRALGIMSKNLEKDRRRWKFAKGIRDHLVFRTVKIG